MLSNTRSPFSPKQQEFFTNATHRWNVKTGATRSGKTYMDYFVIPKRIIKTTGAGHIVLLGNTQQTLERNILAPMRNIWGAGLVGHISTNTGIVKIFDHQCYALGADNVRRVAAIQGSSIEYAYGDEVTTWSESVFTMLKSRLDKPNSCFDGTCNPDTPQHWFHKFLKSDADIYQQQYVIDDNPFLDPDFVRNLKQEYSGTVYYDRFILGKWTLAEGLIYSVFSEERDTYEEIAPEIRARCFSAIPIDYGTANPCVFLDILFDPQESTIYVDREYYYDGRKEQKQNTDEDYGKALLEFSPPRTAQGGIIIDPSALSFRVLLRRLGYRVREADNDVLNGIRSVAMLISMGRLKVNKHCTHTLQEFGAYTWDEKAAEHGIEQPIKQNDHACDAIRYYVNTAVNMNRILRP